MILLCVGSVNPFNRLVRAVDAWAKTNPDISIKSQIGTATFHPENFAHIDFFAQNKDRDQAYDEAFLLVSDLSIETLLPAVERGMPVLALPRLSIFGEEIGIEQVNLASHLKSDDFIHVAKDEHQLHELLSLPRTPFRSKETNLQSGVISSLFQARLVKAMREVG